MANGRNGKNGNGHTHNEHGRRSYSYRSLSRDDPGSLAELPTKDNMTLGALLRIADSLEELTQYVRILTAQVEVLLTNK